MNVPKCSIEGIGRGEMAQWESRMEGKGGKWRREQEKRPNYLIYNGLLTSAPRDSLLSLLLSFLLFTFRSSTHFIHSPPSTLALFPPPTSTHSYLSIMSPAKINGTFLILLNFPRLNSSVPCPFVSRCHPGKNTTCCSRLQH